MTPNPQSVDEGKKLPLLCRIGFHKWGFILFDDRFGVVYHRCTRTKCNKREDLT